jgi:hypothetical protein
MSTSVVRSSFSSLRLATVLLLALCVVGDAGRKRYISFAALNPGPLPGHDHAGVPAPAAGVTATGNHDVLRHHQEQASALVDVGVQAPVTVGVGSVSSVSEVRHQLHG